MNRPLATLGLALLALAGMTTVGEAQPGPPRPPRPPRHVRNVLRPPAPPRPFEAIDPAAIREVRGDLGANVPRAEAAARRAVEAELRTWLAAQGVPESWAPPARLVDRLIVGKATVEPVRVKDLDVFRASLPAEFSHRTLRPILDAYNRQAGGRWLAILGGVLAVVLACLAAFTGYVRADEATKGYYTNHLRVLAAAAAGATGVVVYQVLT